MQAMERSSAHWQRAFRWSVCRWAAISQRLPPGWWREELVYGFHPKPRCSRCARRYSVCWPMRVFEAAQRLARRMAEEVEQSRAVDLLEELAAPTPPDTVEPGA